MSQTDPSLALQALTDWWGEMGVDADETQMRALKKAAAARQAEKTAPEPPARLPRHLMKKTHDDWVNEARELAAAADTLDALKATIEGFEGCILKEAARNTVLTSSLLRGETTISAVTWSSFSLSTGEYQ